MTSPKLKVEFAPGCFDDFEGTQEELDEFVELVKKLFENPEMLEKLEQASIEDADLPEDLEEDIINKLYEQGNKRLLN